MAVKKRGLGRGLDALLPREEARSSTGGLDEIPLEFISPGRFQPRQYFSEESLAELADSIRAQGVMQPIVLRATGKDRYEIIAGERRWRAAQQAGLEKIPAVVREVEDEAVLAMSLIENIQREDLNPLEQAVALQRLLQEFQLTHQEIADAVGKSRSAVTNTLRLTQLPSAVAEMLAAGDLEMGHARALLALPLEQQTSAARTIASRGMSVRQAEALVRDLGRKPSKAQTRTKDADTQRLEQNLSELLGQPVAIRQGGKGKGKLIINYNSLDELDGVLSRLGYREL